MRSWDLENLDQCSGKRIMPDEAFNFRCHAELPCFNRCCRNLNLFLYPYDVLRLKNNLGIDSDHFLDRYVDIVLKEGNYFPEVLLRMSEDEHSSCCFLTPKGCNVYQDRPDTCRSFPMEKGVLSTRSNRSPELIYLFRPPEFCKGTSAPEPHTPLSWTCDQRAETYERMTIKWAELKQMFSSDPWGGQGPSGPKGKMAFMAAYNLDRFRQFVFDSTFLKRYKVKRVNLKKIKTDEQQLLLFAFDWIKLFVWGIGSAKIRPR